MVTHNLKRHFSRDALIFMDFLRLFLEFSQVVLFPSVIKRLKDKRVQTSKFFINIILKIVEYFNITDF